MSFSSCNPPPSFEKAFGDKSPPYEKYKSKPDVSLIEISNTEQRIYNLPRNLFFWGFLLPGPIWFYGFIVAIVVPYFRVPYFNPKIPSRSSCQIVAKEHDERVWGIRCLGAFTMTLLLIGFVILVGYQSDWNMGPSPSLGHGPAKVNFEG